ncbi:tetratricopeptide repeat (TPR)-like superfamily protein [Actinidia rufa]|uniref:Tetratricopeptide repeat (TPR)-like superfamily protein n=1 Tax=Actinidia rufa TaxID=165716 RepID=A0A7J0GRI1_9ERIC|nr:tetratricopeptide repeat (TPR)-like superfamily protein [Actinidia rufa]
MEAVAEGLWGLADHHEKKGEIGKVVKCLEAICQSQVSFLPIVEVKTRLRIATLLLKHSHSVNHAKSHLERCILPEPSLFPPNRQGQDLPSHCNPSTLIDSVEHIAYSANVTILWELFLHKKQILNKGLELTASSGEGFSAKLWFCNFNSQLANALTIEGDYQGSISALESGYNCASEIFYPELQMFFATSILHVHLMHWDDVNLVGGAVKKCNEVWESIQPDKRRQCIGLLFYNELLHIFYLLRICDYKNATQHVETLDAAMKADMQQMQHVQELTKELNALNLSLTRSDLHYRDRSALSEKQAQLEEQLSNLTGLSSAGKESLEPAYFGNVKRSWGDKLELAPPPIDGEWLPKSAVFALVELMVVIFGRPKGLF